MTKMRFAVDFDETLFHTAFPEIKEPNIPLINTCIKLKEQGHSIILWTCRHDEDLEAAINACKTYGLEFDYINENPPEYSLLYTNDSRKVGADYYIDDKAITPENFIKMFNN